MINLCDRDITEYGDKEGVCSACKKPHILSTKIIKGEMLAALRKAAALTYGKALIIASDKAFLVFGREVTDVLSEVTIGVTSFVITGKGLTAKNLYGVGSVGDISLIIALGDAEVFSLAKYYAKIRDARLVLLPTDVNLETALLDYVEIDEGSSRGKVACTAPSALILDERLLAVAKKGSTARAYASIISKMTALLDFRVRVYFGVGGCRECYEALSKIVRSAIGIEKRSPTDRLNFLASNTLKLSALTLFSGGKLTYGAEKEAAYLLGKLGRFSAEENAFLCDLKLMSIYAAYFKHLPETAFTSCDFVGRTERLSSLYGLNNEKIVSKLKIPDYDALVRRREIVKRELPLLIGEAESASALSKYFAETYVLLGGSSELFEKYSTNELKDAIFYSADLGKTSVLRVMRDENLLFERL